MEQQKEKQTDVVFGVETRAFLKEQLHPMRGVRALVHRRALALFPSDQKHLIASLLQGQARLVDPLVRYQVIDHRVSWDKDTNVFDETIQIRFYCVFLHP